MLRRNFINLKRGYANMPNAQLQVYVSGVTDPYINSSIEKWILKKNDPTKQTLYMWHNSSAVMFGRSQNPYKECNLQNIERDNVALIRRYSGGGAVYHSLKNTNFSFMSGIASYNRNRNYNIVISALKNKFGVDAQLRGRNDIVVTDKKVSGSAYNISNNIAIHHGTLLLDVDMADFSKYLNPDKKKLESKGIASVQARVMNLKEVAPTINNQNVTDAIIEEFFKVYDKTCPINYLDEQRIKLECMADPAFIKTMNGYRDWNWIFGHTPQFKYSIDNRFDWGTIEVSMTSDAGLIQDIAIYSDSLFPDMIDLLSKHLKDKRYDKTSIMETVGLVSHEIDRLADMSSEDKTNCKIFAEEFCIWFASTI